MKLALGTVQFGMKYGVANASGRVDSAEVQAILEAARLAGIDTLDTAAAYGSSEQVLGNAGIDGFKIISKIPQRPDNIDNAADWALKSVENSLTDLKADSLYGVLLHRPLELLENYGEELYKMLSTLKSQGMVKKIGVSVYDPEDLDELWACFDFDIVQAPMNILDRRLEKSGWLSELKKSGTEIHIRSAFLQGLLLMPPDKIPDFFEPWKVLLADYIRWTEEQGLSPVQACLGYLNQYSEIDRIVIGVDNARQLRETISAVHSPAPMIPAALQADDLNLINPAFWKL